MTPARTAALSNCPTGQLVTTAVQLNAALTAATPGTIINLASGTYVGPFTLKASGTQAAPITLCGPSDAILDGKGKSHAFYLVNANWWNFTGFQIQHGNKGLDLSGSSNNTVRGLSIHDTTGASVHVESFSSNNTFDDLALRNSGAEGFYIGSAMGNWCMYSNCQADTSNNNVIENSNIAGMTAEPVDVKEGTSGTQVLNNYFDGTTETVKDWVNVKGNYALVSGNVGVNAPQDGYGIHVVATGWGQYNTVTGNSATNGPGYGFYVQTGATGSTIACGQMVTSFTSGYSNIACN
jgi:hypothetical protein